MFEINDVLNKVNNKNVQLEAVKVYNFLEKDFDLENCVDDWSKMDYNEYITDNFKKRYMGLVLDNSKYIKKVYTAVFPSGDVINKIVNSGERNVLLFTHHPMNWDARKSPSFQNINPQLLPKMKEQQISLYTLHVPLDKNGKYSTSVNLAKQLDAEKIRDFCEYFGVQSGIIGKIKIENISQLADKLKAVIGHEVKLYQYGSESIKDRKVAFVSGGGDSPDIVKEIIDLGINTYVTGITRINERWEPSKKAHELLKENNINVIGATHYSTEKFACIEMIKYFNNIGLPCEFIEDEPILEDM